MPARGPAKMPARGPAKMPVRGSEKTPARALEKKFAGAPDQTALCLTELALTDFRCHRFVRLSFAPGITGFAGGNGTGKTSLLEAVSLLQPGRGLRHAATSDWARRDGSGGSGDSDGSGGSGDWAVAASVRRGGASLLLATGATGGRRQYRLDGAAAAAQTLANLLPQLWLTPMSERFFDDERSYRRRFLDRFAALLHQPHGEHARAWERAARERLRLLARADTQTVWLDALEAGMAEHGVAIAKTRLSALDAMSRGLAQFDFAHFPKAEPALAGVLEDGLRRTSDAAVQADLQTQLAANRERDRHSGMTQVGPHRSDLQFLHPSGGSNWLASTGEQKAALLALILAQAFVLAEQFGFRPLLLLDEALVHLDKARRAGLVDLLMQLRVQALVTGQNAEDFSVFTDAGCALNLVVLPSDLTPAP